MTGKRTSKSKGSPQQTGASRGAGKTAASKKRATAKTSDSYHHGDLRQALVLAATQIVEEQGVLALSLRGVARAAGVSQTAPYHHFQDKEALLAMVAETGFQDLADGMKDALDGDASSGINLQALGVAYVLFATSNPGRFRLMFGPQIADKTCYGSLLDVSAVSFNLICEGVAARMKDVGSPLGDLMANTMSAWSSVHGLATLINDAGFNPDTMGAKSIEELAHHVTASLIDGLGREQAVLGDNK
ncbi:MAG: TetR/AcrR family transcriptional regulator [Parvibaculaceae bacterium]|nr:TetR/AcrR family transcriptional regulator [Parvibaculaceae bacterium]